MSNLQITNESSVLKLLVLRRFRFFSSVLGLSSDAGKVLFEWCKQVTDDRDAPRPSQQPLPGQTTHVWHVCVMDREAEHPNVQEKEKRAAI